MRSPVCLPQNLSREVKVVFFCVYFVYSWFFVLCVFSVNLRDLSAFVVFFTTEKRRAREKHGVVPLNLKVLCDLKELDTTDTTKQNGHKEYSFWGHIIPSWVCFFTASVNNKTSHAYRCFILFNIQLLCFYFDHDVLWVNDYMYHVWINLWRHVPYWSFYFWLIIFRSDNPLIFLFQTVITFLK